MKENSKNNKKNKGRPKGTNKVKTNTLNLSTLRNRLLQERENSKLTLMELSDKTGISKTYLGNYESGKSIPNGDDLISLSKVFNNVSIDYLLGLQDNKTSNINDKEVCKRSHLTEKAINNLKQFEGFECLKTFNKIIEDKNFIRLIFAIQEFMNVVPQDINDKNLLEEDLFSLDEMELIKIRKIQNILESIKNNMEQSYLRYINIYRIFNKELDYCFNELKNLENEEVNEEDILKFDEYSIKFQDVSTRIEYLSNNISQIQKRIIEYEINNNIKNSAIDLKGVKNNGKKQ